jgi:superfamily II DNA or RNA helicase
VAAPGAGKTVIGLEIFNRLQLKTLAVSPTTVVRNQWVDRLSLFIPDKKNESDWYNYDLYNPTYFTATTYQALFSFDRKLSGAKEDEIDKQYESLKHWLLEHDIRLLILDEAHHLKAAWWKVLMKLVNASDDLLIVSLTATPPYDASPLEWSRYQQLCGPVDEEISIPELVRSHSLCPHQDYIWMVKTDDKNITTLNRHQQNISKFIQNLEQHDELHYLLSLHQWLDADRTLNTKDILSNLDECFALLGLLKKQEQALPKHLLKQLDLSAEQIEPISVFGWENLLQSFLQGEHYPNAEPIAEFRETLSSLLKGKHFYKHKRVTLDNTRKKLEALNKTQERIKACFDIAQVEHQNRQNWMRLVILTDFIRDEKFQLALDGLEAPTGAYPIFHYFIHHCEQVLAHKTALLTGRISIIHQDLLHKLAQHLPSHLALKPETYSENQHFVVLNIGSDHLSLAFTQLHKQGDLHILIGTRALLGEGWDAPHVNALILATQTGAYVTTNQLRGRAIRIDPNDDLKTASIWHIIATAPNQSYNQLLLKDLHRRFKTFAGIHANELHIESGIERLALTQDDLNKEPSETGDSETANQQAKDITTQSNQIMIQRLQDDIFNLQARWQNALEKVEKHVFQTGLQMRIRKKQRDNLSRYIAKIETDYTPRRSLIRKTLNITFNTAVYLPAGFLSLHFIDHQYWLYDLALTGSAMFFFFLWLAKTLENFSQNERPEKNYYPLKFAQIVLQTAQQTGHIQTKPVTSDSIQIKEIESDYFRFSLCDYSHRENDIFLMVLSQLLEPIQQPRYILTLKEKPDADDIFPVPHLFGKNKKSAEHFLQQWKNHLPEFKHVQLLSTSSETGRTLLLKARTHTYAEAIDDNIRLIERWE